MVQVHTLLVYKRRHKESCQLRTIQYKREDLKGIRCKPSDACIFHASCYAKTHPMVMKVVQ